MSDSYPMGGPAPWLSGFVPVPANRGPMLPCMPGVAGRQRLPTDSIGTAAVTFAGVNAGSEIRVYLPDGSEAAGVESCDADHVLTWGVYPAGSANNTVTVRIVHPTYKIKELVYTVSGAGPQQLPVQQEIDPWYSNP